MYVAHVIGIHSNFKRKEMCQWSAYVHKVYSLVPKIFELV